MLLEMIKKKIINPPYDGSEPCPMCPVEIRNIAALLHNFLVRWPDSRAFEKLDYLRGTEIPSHETVSHPDVKEMLDIARDLVAACEGMKFDGQTISWTPEIRKNVAVIVPRVRENAGKIDALSKAHFRDERHSHGRSNILREERASRHLDFGENYDHHHTVDVVPSGGDMTHKVCGTHLKLHEHFKRELEKDPAFYGDVWCPICRNNAPIEQFALDEHEVSA
jgi:hypothetical protein